MVRLPGVAPGHSPWRGDILLLNHNREKIEAGSVIALPAFSPFQQRTNTSCYLAIPTHGFTVVLSVFGGTPSTKPLRLNSKIRLGFSGSDVGLAWAYHTGDDSKLVFANFTFAPSDITWMSPYRRSLFVSSFVLSLMVDQGP